MRTFVLYGSSTTEFAEQWPDLGYRDRNGYPRTRLAQEEVAYLEGDGAMDVMALRLPYICGIVPGQRPLWQVFLDVVAGQEGPVAVLPGSTSSVTVGQVAQAAVGGLEHGAHGGRYPVNAYDLTYAEFHRLCCEALGRDPGDVVVVPLEAVLPAYGAADEQTAARRGRRARPSSARRRTSARSGACATPSPDPTPGRGGWWGSRSSWPG